MIAGTDPPRIQMMLFPIEDVTLLDTWHVGGLKGTGSGDFSVKDVFVPEELSYALLDWVQQRGGPLYLLRGAGLLATEHGAFALGAARRALEEMRELAKSKRRGFTQQGVAGRSVFQFDPGFCGQALNAARANVLNAYRRAWDRVLETGNVAPPEVEIELRTAAVYATDIAVEVTRRMFRHAGAHALYSRNVIERCMRDMQAASQHFLMSQSSYELWGQAMLRLRGTARRELTLRRRCHAVGIQFPEADRARIILGSLASRFSPTSTIIPRGFWQYAYACYASTPTIVGSRQTRTGTPGSGASHLVRSVM